MRTKGTRTHTYFALARYSGKPPPWDTEVWGQFKTWGEAQTEVYHMGGKVVHVTETLKWEPLKK